MNIVLICFLTTVLTNEGLTFLKIKTFRRSKSSENSLNSRKLLHQKQQQRKFNLKERTSFLTQQLVTMMLYLRHLTTLWLKLIQMLPNTSATQQTSGGCNEQDPYQQNQELSSSHWKMEACTQMEMIKFDHTLDQVPRVAPGDYSKIKIDEMTVVFKCKLQLWERIPTDLLRSGFTFPQMTAVLYHDREEGAQLIIRSQETCVAG